MQTKHTFRTLPFGTDHLQMMHILQGIDQVQKGKQSFAFHREKNIFNTLKALQLFNFSSGFTLTAEGERFLNADQAAQEHILLQTIGDCFAYREILRQLFEHGQAEAITVSKLSSMLAPYHQATVRVNESAAELLASLFEWAGLAELLQNTAGETYIKWLPDARLRLIQADIFQNSRRCFLPYGTNYRNMEQLLSLLQTKNENPDTGGIYQVPAFFFTQKALQSLGFIQGYALTERGKKLLAISGEERQAEVLAAIMSIPAYEDLLENLLERNEWTEINLSEITDSWLIYHRFDQKISMEAAVFFASLMEWAGLGTLAQIAGGPVRIKWEADALQRIKTASALKKSFESESAPQSALSGTVKFLLNKMKQNKILSAGEKYTLNYIQQEDLSMIA